MCDECKTIDKKIEHYREIATRVMDQPTLDGIGALIAKLKSNKKALHPDTDDTQ